MPAFLVQYGRSAFVGRFAAAEPVPAARGDRVVVRTPRGVEVGDVLGPADPRFAAALAPAAGGDLLRPATPDDESAADHLSVVADELVAEADRLAAEAGLPLTVIDAEVLLDGPAVLHAVPWGECDADPLFAALSERFGRPVRLFDVSRTPVAKDPAAKGCGSGGCGTGGCSDGGCGTKPGGCSSGGCSRGAVKSADDLTAYFAGLRGQMEARRTPLN